MIRKTASITLTAFLRKEEKSASVGMKKSCSFRFPKTSRATTPAIIGKRRVKILSRHVATLADFLRKSKLVSVLCGSCKNFNRQYKIKERVKIFLNVQRHISLPRPNETYHFQANLIW